jgi:hypothetical protein
MQGVTEYKPNPGPQEAAFNSDADIMVFGGAAGCSKTNYLVVQPLRHTDNGKFNGIIFRRTSPQIFQPGGLYDETVNWYPARGGVATKKPPKWVFPTGATIAMYPLQYEDDKLNFQGGQFAYIGFDELTHFTESTFFYLLSRNRSMSGIRPYMRATCNPDAGSWVANLLRWWINQETGYPIVERCGRLRWFYRIDERLHWYDSKEEAEHEHPALARIARPKSMTFIPGKVTDNPKLLAKDPDYMASLLALPKIERYRLLEGNWKIAADSVISDTWVRCFDQVGESAEYHIGGKHYRVSKMERFAVIDTAGTSKQKAAEKRGKPPSYTCSAVFDYDPGPDMLLVQDVWRSRVGWNELVIAFPEFLMQWGVQRVLIENAHFGQALADELKKRRFDVRLVGPVVADQQTGRQQSAKLERAIASKLLSRLEFGRILFTPDTERFTDSLRSQLVGWTGLDDETADFVDVLSYACDSRRKRQTFMVAR